ncbi:MAG: response regulator [Methanoregula sp.]
MNETIMIVDDSSFIKDGLVTIFNRGGYNTVSATSGDECLEILKTTTPDIILLDILMEPMDGWETLNSLKANPATAGIPVLVFSAKKITPSEALEHSKDIDGFVAKPVSPVQLMNSIQRILNRRNNGKVEFFVAPGTGLDKNQIDEYTTLPTTIEVDKDLLVILKNSAGVNTPGHVIPAEDLAALQNLEEKIRAEEQRLKEIREKRTGLPAIAEQNLPIKPAIENPVTATEPAPAAEPEPVSRVLPETPSIIPAVSTPETPLPPISPVIPVSREIPVQSADNASHSIEPLFEDPVTATEPAPTAEPEPAPPVTPKIQPTSFVTSPIPKRSAVTPAPVSASCSPALESCPESTKPKTAIIAAVIIVILVVAIGAFVLLKPL